LVTADDTSSTSGALTAMNVLLNKGVFGIISQSSFLFAAYKTAQEQSVPITGGGFDGPEWGTQPNTNMFAYVGGIDPKHPTLDDIVPASALFKSVGTANIAGLAYGISPGSVSTIQDLKTAVEDEGLKMVYQDLSLPFGSSDVGSEVLAMKQADTEMAVCACVQSTVLAVATGLKQIGSTSKSLSLDFANEAVFANPTALQAAQGLYYGSQIPPLDNAASQTLQTNLKAVDPSYQVGTYPSSAIVGTYMSAALMVKGLQVAGQNPTRQTFISNLSQVTNWSADGIYPAPVSFNHFGTAEPSYCLYYVQVAGHQFAVVNGGKTLCADVPSNL
jgi:branched-chain amino acid transport system substrate-binding protein